MTEDASTRESRQFLALAGALFVLGLLLRLYQIDKLELWLDEALTGYLAHSDNWLQRVHNSPPLYFLMVRGWSGLFGLDEGSLRSFSALASAVLIPLAMYTGRSVFSRNAGIAAGVFVLVSPISIYYAQEARPYALLVAELMFVYWMLWRTGSNGGRGTWVLLLGGTTAALYTHNLAAVPLGFGYLLVMFAAWRRHETALCGRYFTAGLASVCLYVPWLLWWVSTTEFHPRDMDWLVRIWESSNAGALPVNSLFAFYHAATVDGHSIFAKQFAEHPVLAGMNLLGIAAVLALCCITAVAAYSNNSTRARALGTTLLLVLPLSALLAISAWKPMYLQGRYDLIAYPAFVLLVGFALSSLKDRVSAMYGAAPAYLACLLLLAPPIVRTAQFYEGRERGISEATAEYLARHAGEDDLVVMEEKRGILTVYYLQLLSYTWTDGRCQNPANGNAFACRFLPVDLETAPAAINRHAQASGTGALGRDAAGLLEDGTYDDVYLLVKELEYTEGQVTLGESIASTITALQERSYAISEIRPGLNLLRLKPQ